MCKSTVLNLLKDVLGLAYVTGLDVRGRRDQMVWIETQDKKKGSFEWHSSHLRGNAFKY